MRIERVVSCGLLLHTAFAAPVPLHPLGQGIKWLAVGTVHNAHSTLQWLRNAVIGSVIDVSSEIATNSLRTLQCDVKAVLGFVLERQVYRIVLDQFGEVFVQAVNRKVPPDYQPCVREFNEWLKAQARNKIVKLLERALLARPLPPGLPSNGPDSHPINEEVPFLEEIDSNEPVELSSDPGTPPFHDRFEPFNPIQDEDDAHSPPFDPRDEDEEVPESNTLLPFIN